MCGIFCIQNAYNNCCQIIFPLRIHQDEVGWGVAPDPTGRGYSFPPELLYGWFQGASLQQDGKKGLGEGQWGMEGGKRGIAPWLLGEIDAPDYIYFMHMHM